MEPHNLLGTAKQFAWVYLRLHRLIGKSLAGGAASLAQMKLLAFLEDGGKRSTDIAGYFGHSPRTVTQAIDALEAAGQVRRAAVPGDRRAKLVEITPVGLTALHAVQPVYQEILQQAFSVLSHDDQAVLDRILNELLIRIETLERS